MTLKILLPQDIVVFNYERDSHGKIISILEHIKK